MVIKNWNIFCLIKKVQFEQGLKKCRSFDKRMFEGRVFQKEKTASTEALRQENACGV